MQTDKTFSNNTKVINPNQTMYEAYITSNQENLSAAALYDFENNVCLSHGELIEKIDTAASAFVDVGISENSVVGIMTDNSIYEPVCFMALNKLGSVTKFLDFSKDIDAIIESIAVSKIDWLIIEFDFINMIPLINKNNLPVIIIDVFHPSETNDYISLNNLLYSHKNTVHTAQYRKEKPSIIINSSGTTGTPKPIVHSDYTLNVAVNKILHTDFPLNRNNLIMKWVPSHIGLGIITTLYTSLLSGTPIVFVKFKSPSESASQAFKIILGFKEFIKSHNISKNAKLLLFIAPFLVRAIYDNLDKIDDLSFIGTILAAGSKMEKTELDIIEPAFRDKGCTVPICNGYGQNEMCGAVTLNYISKNKNGSAGIPIDFTEVTVVSPDSFLPVPIGTTGKILERSESRFLYYDNAPLQTEQAFIKLNDGLQWFDTNDLGYLDSDGFLHVTGRTSRVLIRFDHKISIDAIEQTIRSNPEVQDCAVIPIFDNTVNESAIAFVEFKHYNNYTSSDDILEHLTSNGTHLSPLEMPSHFIKIKKIPYMNNGKVDYIKLEKLAKQM